MNSSTNYWCIKSYIPSRPKEPWYGKLCDSSEHCYLEADNFRIFVNRNTDLFETKEEAQSAYIKVEQKRVDNLFKTWAKSLNHLLTFKDTVEQK